MSYSRERILQKCLLSDDTSLDSQKQRAAFLLHGDHRAMAGFAGLAAKRLALRCDEVLSLVDQLLTLLPQTTNSDVTTAPNLGIIKTKITKMTSNTYGQYSKILARNASGEIDKELKRYRTAVDQMTGTQARKEFSTTLSELEDAQARMEEAINDVLEAAGSKDASTLEYYHKFASSACERAVQAAETLSGDRFAADGVFQSLMTASMVLSGYRDDDQASTLKYNAQTTVSLSLAAPFTADSTRTGPGPYAISAASSIVLGPDTINLASIDGVSINSRPLLVAASRAPDTWVVPLDTGLQFRVFRAATPEVQIPISAGSYQINPTIDAGLQAAFAAVGMALVKHPDASGKLIIIGPPSYGLEIGPYFNETVIDNPPAGPGDEDTFVGLQSFHEMLGFGYTQTSVGNWVPMDVIEAMLAGATAALSEEEDDFASGASAEVTVVGDTLRWALPGVTPSDCAGMVLAVEGVFSGEYKITGYGADYVETGLFTVARTSPYTGSETVAGMGTSYILNPELLGVYVDGWKVVDRYFTITPPTANQDTAFVVSANSDLGTSAGTLGAYTSTLVAADGSSPADLGIEVGDTIGSTTVAAVSGSNITVGATLREPPGPGKIKAGEWETVTEESQVIEQVRPPKFRLAKKGVWSKPDASRATTDLTAYREEVASVRESAAAMSFTNEKMRQIIQALELSGYDRAADYIRRGKVADFFSMTEAEGSYGKKVLASAGTMAQTDLDVEQDDYEKTVYGTRIDGVINE